MHVTYLNWVRPLTGQNKLLNRGASMKKVCPAIFIYQLVRQQPLPVFCQRHGAFISPMAFQQGQA